jgi:hypothetical protein
MRVIGSTTSERARVLSGSLKVGLTLDSIKTTRRMVKAFLHGRTERFTMASLKVGSNMGSARGKGSLAIHISESGVMDTCRGTADTNGKMETFMKGNGLSLLSTARELTVLKTGTFTLDSIGSANHKDLEATSGRTVPLLLATSTQGLSTARDNGRRVASKAVTSIKVNFTMTSSMAVAFSPGKMETSTEVITNSITDMARVK